MPTRPLTPEQELCFNSAVELASAAIASGAISNDAEAVKDYIVKMYPALRAIVRTLPL